MRGSCKRAKCSAFNDASLCRVGLDLEISGNLIKVNDLRSLIIGFHENGDPEN